MAWEVGKGLDNSGHTLAVLGRLCRRVFSPRLDVWRGVEFRVDQQVGDDVISKGEHDAQTSREHSYS